MKITPIFLKTLLTSIIFSYSLSAQADNSLLKIAVVKDSIGAQDIVLGNINSSIEKLTSVQKANKGFNTKLNLCAAYLKSTEKSKSELACTAAIKDIESKGKYTKKTRYLKSLSYSNRAIARYQSKNIYGALTDINTAISTDSNAITKANFTFIKQYASESSTDDSNELAD